jgi:hypothetical protein
MPATIAGLVLLFGESLHAQQAGSSPQPGPFARVVVIAPKPGQDSAFEAGYQRHLAWHRDHRDPWIWYGWSFVLGDRIEMFMDGTFGHAAGNFDHAVDPGGDGADNDANVAPFANFVSHAVYEHLPDASRGALLPDTTAFLALTTYQIAPGREADFENLPRARAGTGARHSWYRVRTGGEMPQYVLMRAAATWSVAIGLADYFAAARDIHGMVRSTRSELLRFRPTLSYRP